MMAVTSIHVLKSRSSTIHDGQATKRIISSNVNQAWQIVSMTKNGFNQFGVLLSSRQSDLAKRGSVSTQSKTIATNVAVTETNAIEKAALEVSGCSNKFHTPYKVNS
jgi:hypothetical protein